MITFGGHSPTCHSLTSYSRHCWFLCTGLRGVASSAEVRMTWPRSSTCSSIAFGARRWGRCSKIWSVSSVLGWDSVNPCFTLFFTPQKYKLWFSSFFRSRSATLTATAHAQVPSQHSMTSARWRICFERSRVSQGSCLIGCRNLLWNSPPCSLWGFFIRSERLLSTRVAVISREILLFADG